MCIRDRPYEEKYLEKIEELIEAKIDRIDPPEGAIREQRSRRPRREDEKSDKPRRNSRRRNEKPAEAQEAAVVAEPVEATPALQSEPKPQTQPKSQSQPQAEAPRQQSNSNENRNRGRGGRGRRRDDLGPPVVGLGDHVPAFLNIPLPELKTTRKKTAEVEEPVEEGSDDEAA